MDEKKKRRCPLGVVFLTTLFWETPHKASSEKSFFSQLSLHYWYSDLPHISPLQK